MKKFKFNKISIIVLAIAFTLGLGGIVVALAPGAIDLGRANSFAVLAGAGTTNTGTTTITGDVGSYATVSQTGLGSETIYGTNYLGTGPTQDAKTDLTAALVATSGAVSPTPIPVTANGTDSFNNIGTGTGGYTLAPGIYNSASAMGISAASPLILNGGGNPNAVFIFQAGSSLTSAGSSSVTLENGAQACNVFWYVYSAANLGTYSHMVGTIMTDTEDITDAGYSTINGRLLTSSGAVILNNTTVTVPTCVVPHLHVIKHVVGGPGSVTASNFSTTISGVTTAVPTATGAESPGVDNILTSLGTYTVTEPTGGIYDGYTKTTTGECGPTVISLESPTHTCTIINTYKTPKLTLDKIVDNSAGGTAPESTWTLTATGNTTISGAGASSSTDVVSGGTFLAGTYALSESGTPTNYTASAWSCLTRTGTPVTVTDASVIIAPGDDVICTITNTYTSQVVHHSSSGSMPRVVAPIFEPSITILSTPVVAHIIPKLPKTGFPTASTLGQQVKTIESNLRKGSNGGNVTTLQQFLISENKGGKAIALKDSGADGKFGPITEAALAEWQTDNVLIGDGIFGQKTRAYLSAHY